MTLTTEFTKSLVWAITMMELAAHTIRFQCFPNVGHTPSFQQLLKNVSMEPIPWRVSAIECASLCLQQSCISYAYDPLTLQCFITNVNVRQTGILCGTAVNQARDKCKVIGDSFIAYGGTGYTPIQCVCGGSYAPSGAPAPNWFDIPNIAAYDCIDTCTQPFCQLHLGFSSPCKRCQGDSNSSFCAPKVGLYGVKPAVCGKAV